MEPNKVSKKLMNRLPIYLNHLKSLPAQSENISATSIAKALGLGDVSCNLLCVSIRMFAYGIRVGFYA